jgi:hypothetical protein
MLEPRLSVTQFVNWAARAESARPSDERETLVAQRILTRLREQLTKLIGPAGFDALLGRSLVLARRTRPAFARVMSVADDKLEGLDPSARETLDFDDSALAIVAHFVELLVTLIGEDLALGTLRDFWPSPAVSFGALPASRIEFP